MAYHLDSVLKEISHITKIYDRSDNYHKVKDYVVIGYNGEIKLYCFCSYYYNINNYFYKYMLKNGNIKMVNESEMDVLDCDLCNDKECVISIENTDDIFYLCKRCYEIYNTCSIEICNYTNNLYDKFTNNIIDKFYLNYEQFLVLKTTNYYLFFYKTIKKKIHCFRFREIAIHTYINSYNEIIDKNRKHNQTFTYNDNVINEIISRQTYFARLVLLKLQLIDDIKRLLLTFIIDICKQ